MLFRIHSNFKFLIYFDHIAGVPGTDHHSSPTTTTVGVMGQVTAGDHHYHTFCRDGVCVAATVSGKNVEDSTQDDNC